MSRAIKSGRLIKAKAVSNGEEGNVAGGAGSEVEVVEVEGDEVLGSKAGSVAEDAA